MKTNQIFNMIITLGLLCLLCATIAQGQITKEKSYRYDYTVNPTKLLDFDNQFGKMHIETWNSDKVQIDVLVSVTQRTESRAVDMLNAINISANDSKSAVVVKTTVNGKTNNKNGESFTIDYKIKMPKSSQLKAKQSFGELYVADLDGNANLDVSYGSIKAGALNGNNQIKISFSNGEIGSSRTGNMVIKYSNIEIGSIENQTIDQQFSDVIIDKANNIDLEAKYGSIKIGEVETIRGSSDFSNFKIDRLNKLIDVETSYGNGVELRKLSPDFQSVRLTGKFSGFTIALPEDIHANFDVQTEFCELKTRSERISFQTRIKDMNKGQFIGKIGKGGNTINIISSYGDVKFEN